VFSHNRYGTYIRRRATPTVSTTAYALAAKALLTSATQAWQALAAAQQETWNSWASSNPVPGSLGQAQALTGHAAFVGSYVRMSKLGQAPLTDPPISPAPTGLEAVSVVPDETAGTCNVTFLATPLPAGCVLWFMGCYVSSAGKHWVQNLLKWCPISAVAPASPYDAYANITGRLGNMVIGNRLILEVSVANNTTGLISSPLRCEGTIV
jgi:hypothetical protein